MIAIRNIKTGLYQCGGDSVRWSKSGKSWSGPGPVKNHLRMVAYYPRYWKDKEPQKYEEWIKNVEDWEIIEYNIETGISKTVKVLDFYPRMFEMI